MYYANEVLKLSLYKGDLKLVATLCHTELFKIEQMTKELTHHPGKSALHHRKLSKPQPGKSGC
jgi:hypothetical protein